MIMCDARCKRRARTLLHCLSSRRSAGTSPAVLHRHCATENRVTRLTQSRASRNESSVSLNPNPSGLTTPAATTATRAVNFFPFALVDLTIFWGRKKMIPDSYCFLKRSILLVKRDGKTEARQLVDCQLSLFSGDLKSDKREQ